MWLFFISIILLSISIFLFVKTKEKVNNNKELEKEENKIKERIEKLKNEYKEDTDKEDALLKRLTSLDKSIQINKDIMGDSMAQYIGLLETTYEKEEQSHDDAIDSMRYAYDLEQDRLMAEIANVQKDLDKIRATRIAAQEAILKEKEIKEKLDFYCLHPSQEELDDIQTLERIKPKLHQPRILCMLIWSTYYQKPMTALCNNVLGPDKICGIYKITNQETDECYIGQAVDVATRWKDHAKCGLGIDTPANNKLYKAMQEYGLNKFSFELIEKCDRDLLNEKEKYYIELYDSCNYGYNSTIGVKRVSFDELKNL